MIVIDVYSSGWGEARQWVSDPVPPSKSLPAGTGSVRADHSCSDSKANGSLFQQWIFLGSSKSVWGLGLRNRLQKRAQKDPIDKGFQAGARSSSGLERASQELAPPRGYGM